MRRRGNPRAYGVQGLAWGGVSWRVRRRAGAQLRRAGCRQGRARAGANRSREASAVGAVRLPRAGGGRSFQRPGRYGLAGRCELLGKRSPRTRTRSRPRRKAPRTRTAESRTSKSARRKATSPTRTRTLALQNPVEKKRPLTTKCAAMIAAENEAAEKKRAGRRSRREEEGRRRKRATQGRRRSGCSEKRG